MDGVHRMPRVRHDQGSMRIKGDWREGSSHSPHLASGLPYSAAIASSPVIPHVLPAYSPVCTFSLQISF